MLSISDPQFECRSSYLSLSVDLHADSLILQICCSATSESLSRCFVSVSIQVTFTNPSILSKIIKSHVGLREVCFIKYHSLRNSRSEYGYVQMAEPCISTSGQLYHCACRRNIKSQQIMFNPTGKLTLRGIRIM